jgi:hypothetical protein
MKAAHLVQYLHFGIRSPICCQLNLCLPPAQKSAPADCGRIRGVRMTVFFACCNYWPRLIFKSGILRIAAIAYALQHQALAADTIPVPSVRAQIIVYIDQAKVLKLPERTATLVVGNPLIADAAVQPGGMIVITAKSYGDTNLIALDRTGTTLMEHRIRVLGPTDNVVVLYRGIERESYSCMPNCERRISLGDTPNYFMATLSQTNNVNTLAQGKPQK